MKIWYRLVFSDSFEAMFYGTDDEMIDFVEKMEVAHGENHTCWRERPIDGVWKRWW